MYSCIKCLKVFSHDDSLKIHLRIHSGEKPYPCHQCLKSFMNASNLKNHLKVHSGESHTLATNVPKLFHKTVIWKCIQVKNHILAINVCLEAFSHVVNFKNHLKKEKPYPCNHCPKAFSLSSYLKSHLRIHTGEKTYVCNQCTKAFSDKTSLKYNLSKQCLKKITKTFDSWYEKG